MFACSGAWASTEAAVELMEDIFAAARAANLNDQQLARVFDVPASKVSEMRACREAGPGVLRLAHLPVSWWAAFIAVRAKRIGLQVIADAHLGALVAKLDAIQLRMQRMDLTEAKNKQERAS